MIPAVPEARRYCRPELDVLRFGAFFMVFLSHVVPGDASFYDRAHVPSTAAQIIIGMAAGGAFGVDLFFALSSFLITTLLLREREAYGSIDVPAFYVRRMLRIWPLYFVFLLIVLPGVAHMLPDQSLPLKFLLAFLLLSGNWACVLWGYPHSVASPLWSVSLEEQFYLAWPLVLRRFADRLVTVALALLAVSCIARLYSVAQGAVHPQIWCNSLCRLDPFACGALLAVYERRKGVATSQWVRILLFGAAAALLTAIGHTEDFTGMKLLATLPAAAVAGGALIFAALGARPDRAQRPVPCALAYLGKVSYGLYVFHSTFVLMLGVPSARGPLERSIRAAIALLLTIAAAAASYRWLEKPFLRYKEQFARIRSRPA